MKSSHHGGTEDTKDGLESLYLLVGRAFLSVSIYSIFLIAIAENGLDLFRKTETGKNARPTKKRSPIVFSIPGNLFFSVSLCVLCG